MAKLPKFLLKPNESKYLLEQGLIYSKSEDIYGIRDKDLDTVLEYIKNKGIHEAQSTDSINNRTYTLRVVTIIMQMIKKASTLTEQIALLSCINSLYPIANDESIRLLSLLKSSMDW